MAPAPAVAMYRWVTSADVRDVLPSIMAPTLVLHRRDARHHRLAFGRYLAERIPGAKLLELDGADTLPFHAGDVTPLLSAIEVFLTGTEVAPTSHHRLTTILISDLVGSTELASGLGDARWHALMRTHDEVIRAGLARFRGEELVHTGDGMIASFDGPTRAVLCAQHLSRALADIGLTVRIGLHTGEVELRPEGARGLAVHVAHRVMAVASDGGVLASRTVRDLAFGSGITFTPIGGHRLRGVPGTWELYRIPEVEPA
jgi:class 3 adenylate cyclase